MDFNMDEVKSVIKTTMTELNSKDEAHATEVQKLNDQISELNSQLEAKDSMITEKDGQISELNASVEQLKKALADMKSDQETYWAERNLLEAELAKAKVAEKLAELDNALNEFNEEEKSVAKDDIEKLKEDINTCKKSDELNNVSSEINSIKSKICMAIVEKQKADEKEQKKISEQNSYGNNNVEDIFSEMYMEAPVKQEPEDLNIF